MRDAIPPHERAEASQRIGKLAAEMAEAGMTVFVYASIGSEVETDHLIRLLWERGCRVCLPVIRGKGRMEAIAFAQGDPLRTGRFGIKEPMAGERVAPNEIDIALIPLLAYDRSGGRLGYGGGYYDRFLAGCPAKRIGLAYAAQCIERCPADPWDIGLHRIVNENGIFEAESRLIQ